MFQIGDRVVRRSSPEADTGTIQVVYEHNEHHVDRVRVRWDASGRSSRMRVDTLKAAPVEVKNA